MGAVVHWRIVHGSMVHRPVVHGTVTVNLAEITSTDFDVLAFLNISTVGAAGLVRGERKRARCGGVWYGNDGEITPILIWIGALLALVCLTLGTRLACREQEVTGRNMGVNLTQTSGCCPVEKKSTMFCKHGPCFTSTFACRDERT